MELRKDRASLLVVFFVVFLAVCAHRKRLSPRSIHDSKQSDLPTTSSSLLSAWQRAAAGPCFRAMNHVRIGEGAGHPDTSWGSRHARLPTAMKQPARWLTALFCSACVTAGAQTAKEERAMSPSVPHAIYDFTVKDIDGKDVSLADYKGKVLLVVNVASKCGFTPQYKDLQAIYDKYKDRGFVVLGFPANNFLWQEPGSNEQIKQFCALHYSVTFPMFEKISVKGSDQHPLYAFLTSKKTNPEFAGKITWNFNKFLIGRNGRILGRFGSRTTPEDKTVLAAIETALGQP
jgi:glutathione peroxidase